MKIFFNISHPAHVHFFKNVIWGLQERGHEIFIGARNKEFTTSLLDRYGFRYTLLTQQGRGVWGLAKELATQQVLLAKLIKKYRFDMMLQIGGIFNAPVGKLFGIPAIAISDTENDTVGNNVSFNLSSYVLIPSCFDHVLGGTWRNQIHYPGYHELSYLAPTTFKEDITYENNFLVRFVGWGAGHDIGEKWLADWQKKEIIEELEQFGDVYVSSEMTLPENLKKYEFTCHPAEIHSFMRRCKLVVGESATMASEAASLGIPAIFLSNTGRGYTTEQDKRYGLIKHFELSEWKKFKHILVEWAGDADIQSKWLAKRKNMLREKIFVAQWLIDFIENYPQSVETSRLGDFEKYKILCVE